MMYASVCPVCFKTSVNNFWPCRACELDIKFAAQEKCCRKCGILLAGTDNPCPACREQDFHFEEIKSLGHWRGALREWVSMIKYGGDIRLTNWVTLQLTKICLETWPNISVIPVPPRKKRIFNDGIDPVGVIANKMKRSGILIEPILKRIGSETQKSLNRSNRIKKTSLNYRLKNPDKKISGKKIILDDVSTTGATLDCCAQILKNAGADCIYCLVICKD